LVRDEVDDLESREAVSEFDSELEMERPSESVLDDDATSGFARMSRN
jgi:hypothetical protein